MESSWKNAFEFKNIKIAFPGCLLRVSPSVRQAGVRNCILLLLLLPSLSFSNGKKKLYVADRKIACAGSFQCLQIKDKAKAPWRLYSDTISGFNYAEGYAYLIKVLPLQTGNTLNGLYDEKYRLLKIISKKKTGYSPGLSLDKRKWILSVIYDTKNTLTLKDSTIYILFNIKAGKISGTTTCNSFTGTVKISGKNTLGIGPLASTKKLCAEKNKMTFEKIILRFLQESTSYSIEGNNLTLEAPSGDKLTFRTD